MTTAPSRMANFAENCFPDFAVNPVMMGVTPSVSNWVAMSFVIVAPDISFHIANLHPEVRQFWQLKALGVSLTTPLHRGQVPIDGN